jgi:putative endopeptidase
VIGLEQSSTVTAMKRCLVLLLVLLAACSKKTESPPSEPAPKPAPGSGSGSAPAPTPTPASPGIDVAGMDRTVKPGDDFFMYANGGWFKTTEIPPDRSSAGTGVALVELTAKRTAELIKADTGQVGTYYSTFMDEAAIEAKGLAPLQPELDRIAAIKDAKELAKELGATVRSDTDALNNTNFETPNIFGLWVAQDLDDPKVYVPFLMQGGLALPDRDYYLDPSPRMAEYRTKYQAHVAKLFELAKRADAAAAAKRVLDLEVRIAKAHGTRVDSADVHKGNNHWARADFDKKAPGMDWAAFFEGAGLASATGLVVWQPTAPTGIAAAVKAVPLATWKDYLTAHALDRAAPLLPKAFADESFAFYGTALSGIPTQRDRWKRAVDATSFALGEAVGKLYVEKYFPAAEKQRAAKMVEQLIAAFGRRIDALAWMAPATKEKAKAKLKVLIVGVGYPDTWRDYSGLEIKAGDALGNAQRATLFEYQRNLARIGKPVDRKEWVMVPHLVNAVNMPAMNAMNFPAAILQPPFFDPARPDAMDYGAIGSVIGHEISHSFDDQGAQFDATGKLENWWSKDDFAHFKEASQKLVEQYNGYKPFPDLAVNGKLTLSENIADVAGLAVAYDAYRAAHGGKDAPAVDGMTGDQQFFLSYAQSWRGKYREPALRRRLLTDGHSPAEYRADTVRNLDAWYTAFDVQPGQKLFLAPEARVKMW